MCSKNDLNIILKEMLAIYNDIYGNDIVGVYLYGSYARGTNDSDSDIDIVAIVHGDRQILQNKLKAIWDKSSDLELEYETIISPTVIPFDEYEKYKNDLPYYRNIQNEGVLVVA